MSTQEERPVVKATAAASAGGGDLSALLLDAKLGELINSIRALVRSNDELRAALTEHPGDRDFIIALRENEEVIVKRREVAAEMVRKLRGSGIDVDLPQDVLEMNVEWKGSSGGENGAATAADGASKEAATADEDTSDLPAQGIRDDTNKKEEAKEEAASADGGVYL